MKKNGHQSSVRTLIETGVLLINDGYRAKNSELSNVGIPFARAGNIDDGFHFAEADKVPETTFRRVGLKYSLPGDVVFTSKGTVGRFAYVRESTPKFVYSPQLCYWRSLDSSTIDSRWLFYWMSGPDFFRQFKQVAGQTDMAEYVSLRDQRAMRIQLPTIKEQRLVAGILGALDDKIELNRRMNATLEATARALFQSWFVDFDPVRAKLDGRAPFGLDEATAALFPDRFVESSTDRLPDGFRRGTVNDIAQIARDTIDPSRFSGETFDHYSLPSFDNNRTPTTELGATIKSNKFVVPAAAVLLSKLNPHIPRVWRPDLVDVRRSVCSTEFIVVTSKPGFNRDFLYSLFLNDEFTSRYQTLVAGTTGSHQRIQPQEMLNLPIVIPPTALAAKFAEIVGPLLSRVNHNLHQSRTLAALRDTLLPKLLSGELRVPDLAD